ncbi:MAG: hypothetical protein AAFV95_00415 [Bacteroidota bacterium]
MHTSWIALLLLFVGDWGNISPNPSEPIAKLKLSFAKIDEETYEAHRQQYSNQLMVDSTIVNEAGGEFSLPVDGEEKTFRCGANHQDCTYYRGFLTPLNQYVLTHCGTGYCITYLLDKASGLTTNLPSPYDSECDIPSLSKDQKKLLIFASSVFYTESFIALYERDDKTQKIDFGRYDSYESTDFRIKEIIWIDSQSIALKVFDEYGGTSGGELVNKRYLKATIN